MPRTSENTEGMEGKADAPREKKRKLGGALRTLANISGGVSAFLQAIPGDSDRNRGRVCRAMGKKNPADISPSFARELMQAIPEPEDPEGKEAYRVLRERAGEAEDITPVRAPRRSTARTSRVRTEVRENVLRITGMGIDTTVAVSYDSDKRQITDGGGNRIVVSDGSGYLLQIKLSPEQVDGMIPLTHDQIRKLLISK